MARAEWANLVDCTCPCHTRVSDSPYCDGCTDVDQTLCLRELRASNDRPTNDGLHSGQTWVWMRPEGGVPHWEVRGTGAIWSGPTVQR